METPVTDIEKQRLVLSYEEKLTLLKATNYVKNRLLEQKMRERELQWHTKESELHENEIAMLNILEDARALEEELEKQRSHLDLIIASMGEGLLLIDEIFRITLINAKAAALLGLRAEDAKGKDMRTVVMVWQGDELIADKTVLQHVRSRWERQPPHQLPTISITKLPGGKNFPSHSPFLRLCKKRG